MADIKRIAAGYRYMRYGVVDSDGKFVGSTTTAPTNGDVNGSGLLRLDGARTLPMQLDEPDVQTVTGDDEPLVTFEFDAESLPSGIFEMAVRDNDFEALAQGTKVNKVGNIELSVLDPKDRKSQTLVWLLSRRAKSWAAGEKGAKKWNNLLLPQTTVKPLGGTWEQRTFSPYQYAINLSRADQLPWTTVNESEHGTCAASMFPIDSDHPLLFHTWRGDNATTAYTLPIALVSGGSAWVFVDNVRQTTATVSGTTVDFSAPGAPGAGAIIVVLWEISEGDCS
jgi:hypothetical protein